MFCREQVACFNESLPLFETLGVQVVGVGNGTATQAKAFVEEFDVNFPVFSDPTREAFAGAGMKTRLGFGLSIVRNVRRATKAGFRQGKTQGAPFQQGGIVLVDGSGKRLFTHVDTNAGDHMPPRRVLQRITPLLKAVTG